MNLGMTQAHTNQKLIDFQVDSLGAAPPRKNIGSVAERVKACENRRIGALRPMSSLKAR